jgi:hypothetical protein
MRIIDPPQAIRPAVFREKHLITTFAPVLFD